MTTPTTPAAALAEQERWQEMLEVAEEDSWNLEEQAIPLARAHIALLGAYAEALALLRDCDTELADLMRRVRRLAENAPDDDTTDADELRRRIAALPAQAPAAGGEG